MAGDASDFQKFITDARERKRNEALADRIFSRDRRQSAPSRPQNTPGRSLASRVGVNKRASYGSWRPSKGDLNTAWPHDLHDTVNHRRQHASSHESPRTGTNRRQGTAQRSSRLASAMDKMDVDQLHVRRGNTTAPTPSTRGISIKGLAGPFCVMAQNFAPGTTAADIESAMTPIGGEMIRCDIVKTTPLLVAEMVFASREAAERVIETFNEKTADGRVLKVYFQGDDHGQSQEPARAPRPRRDDYPRDQVVDGTRGFTGDLMDTDDDAYNDDSSRPLYSDKIVARSRRGRGFQRE